MAGRRPGGVTLVGVLTIIQGIFWVIVGLLSFIQVPLGIIILDLGYAGDSFIEGLVSLVYGIVAILLGAGLFGGSRFARALVTIWLVLGLVGAAIQLVQGAVVGGVVNLAFGIIGILLLWGGKADRFFRG